MRKKTNSCNERAGSVCFGDFLTACSQRAGRSGEERHVREKLVVNGLVEKVENVVLFVQNQNTFTFQTDNQNISNWSFNE